MQTKREMTWRPKPAIPPTDLARILTRLTSAGVCIALLAACEKSSEPSSATTGSPSAPAAGSIVEPPAKVEDEDPAEKFLAMPFNEALAAATSLMADSDDEHSLGFRILRDWSVEKLKWTDVAVPKNETSFKLVKKDSDEARGKRMCFSGRILQIEKISSKPPGYAGLIATSQMQIVSFASAGSTGELVEDSRARFCGVVTGRHQFPNVGGGTTLSIAMVGMFDLPENKPPSTANAPRPEVTDQ